MAIQLPRVRNRADMSQVFNALAGPFVLMAPLALGLRGPELLGAWLAVWLYICRHNYILHNHVHHPFTDSKWFNRYLDWSLGFVTAMTAGNWRIMHVHGHHVEHLAELLPTRAHASRLRVDDIQRPSTWQVVAHCLVFCALPIRVSDLAMPARCARPPRVSLCLFSLPLAGGCNRLRSHRRGHLDVWVGCCPIPSANLFSRLLLLSSRRLHHTCRRGVWCRLCVRQRLPVSGVQSLVLEFRLSRRASPRAKNALESPTAGLPVLAGGARAAGQHRNPQHLWALPPSAAALDGNRAVVQAEGALMAGMARPPGADRTNLGSTTPCDGATIVDPTAISWPTPDDSCRRAPDGCQSQTRHNA